MNVPKVAVAAIGCVTTCSLNISTVTFQPRSLEAIPGEDRPPSNIQQADTTNLRTYGSKHVMWQPLSPKRVLPNFLITFLLWPSFYNIVSETMTNTDKLFTSTMPFFTSFAANAGGSSLAAISAEITQRHTRTHTNTHVHVHVESTMGE